MTREIQLSVEVADLAARIHARTARHRDPEPGEACHFCTEAAMAALELVSKRPIEAPCSPAGIPAAGRGEREPSLKPQLASSATAENQRCDSPRAGHTQPQSARGAGMLDNPRVNSQQQLGGDAKPKLQVVARTNTPNTAAESHGRTHTTQDADPQANLAQSAATSEELNRTYNEGGSL